MTQPPRGIPPVKTSAAHSVASSSDDSRVVAAMQEYMQALERGETPSLEAFLAKYASIATELADCIDGLALVHEAARDMQQFAASTGNDANAEMLKQPLGDFRLNREIGRGGMGVVYEAMQLSLGRRVAVKVLPFAASFDPKHLQRFKNEAQAAAQLHHTNIVPIYGVGAERGIHFYAMQLIEGYSLAALIAERRLIAHHGGATPSPGKPRTVAPALTLAAMKRKLAATDPTEEIPAFISHPPRSVAHHPTEPIAKAETVPAGSQVDVSATTADHLHYFRFVAELMRQAATAIDYAHQFGVVHRDIKPANLLVDARHNLWITDFGLAMIRSDVQMTRSGDVLGTLRYMSPEQAAGDRTTLDHRTDIYSLGATLFELLTLEPVISGDDPKTLLRRILMEEPRSPRSIEKRIPVELETIVLKAIAKSPNERYRSAQALADDLQRWLEDKPIRARRPTLFEQIARWNRRNRNVVRAGIVLLCIACFALFLHSVFIANEHAKTKAAFQRESLARREAEASFKQARRAVDAFTELGEEELANRPSLYQLRRKFLATSLGYYKSFLEQRKTDPSVQEELKATSEWIEQIVEELSLLEHAAPLFLLTDRRVQQELALTADQVTIVNGVLEHPSSEGDRTSSGSKSGVSAGRSAVDQLRFLESQMSKTLQPKQMQRLRQIAFQQRGPFVFKSPEIIASLQLTNDQRTRIQQIIEEQRPDKRGKGSNPPPDMDHEHDFGPGGSKGGKRRPEPGGFSSFDDGMPDDFDRDFGPPRKKGGPHSGPGDFGFGPEFDDRPPHDKHHGPHDFGGEFGPGEHGPAGFGPGGSRPPRKGELWSAMKRTVAKIVEILTPQQQAKWQELVGEPFDYDLGWRPDDQFPQ